MSPLLIGVQEACGRIGNVTGQGLARNIKNRYSLHILRLLVILLATANVINIGADLVLQPHLETFDSALVMDPPGAGLVAATPA